MRFFTSAFLRRCAARALCAVALLSPWVASGASALITAGGADVEGYAASAATDSITLFTHRATGGERQLLGVVTRDEVRAMTSVRWFAQQGQTSARKAELDLAALEHLYEKVLRMDPVGKFELQSVRQDTKGSVEASKAGPAQADVLRALALARQRAAADLASSGNPLKPRSWSVASIEVLDAPSGQKADRDLVRVLVRNERGQPIVGVTITASRGADTICSEKSDSRGVASCALVDVHGHQPGDDKEDEAAPTIVTFPGVVSPERIDLPTTLELPRTGR